MAVFRQFASCFSFFTLLHCSSALTAEWIELKPKQVIHPPRSGHVAFKLKEEVYVFGGYAEDSGKDGLNRFPTNDMWRFNPEQSEWEKVGSENLYLDDCEECNENIKIPQQRLAAAVACLDDDSSAFLFGGWDPQRPGTGGVILDGISEFSQDGGWKGSTLKDQVDLGETTSRHVALTIAEDTILLHNHRCTDSVLLFRKQGQRYSLERQQTTGTSPSPRGLHAACRLGSNKVLVFAGAAQDGQMSNQVFVLDTSLWTWKELSSSKSPQSKMPAPRASPCLCAIDEQTCVVFGGASPSEKGGLHGWDDLWIMRIDTESDTVEWEELVVEGKPPGRNAATLTPISKPSQIPHDNDADTDGNTAKYFLLSGGWTPFVKTHGDNFVLKLSNL